jgi:hypothetical protein
MIKKLSYILIPLIMLGVFLAPVSPVLQIRLENTLARVQINKAEAQLGGVGGTGVGADICKNIDGIQTTVPIGFVVDSAGNCTSLNTGAGTTGTTQSGVTLHRYLKECQFPAQVIGCFLHILYFFLVTVPSWLLVLTAQMFNYLAALTLSDKMYTATFIEKIWIIIRDFSNIFFILILLYAAFQIILGIGHGGGGKKIVASVILVALLVNFSLFISKVVIDSSNVLALIFYNKIECKQTDGTACPGDAKPTTDVSKTGIKEKDLSSALVSRFDVNKFFTAEFFRGLENDPRNWRNANRIGTQATAGSGEGTLDDSVAIALMVTYGLVIYPLAWIFLVVGLSFLGRMIMLMLLMIVSPLAFVTASVPKFSSIDTIGFNSWIKKLFEVSFVATIFMAILYLVYEIMRADIFNNSKMADSSLDVTQRLLLIFIPAILIVVLLKKGSSYAQKASGEFTGMILSAAKVVGGIGLGAGMGAAAFAGSRAIGGISNKIANSESLKRWTHKKEIGEDGKERLVARKGLGGFAGRMALRTANAGTKQTFDMRKTALGGALSKGLGMDFQSAKMIGLGSKEGGFKGASEREAKKLQEESEFYKTKMTDKEVQEHSAGEQAKYDAKKNEALMDALKRGPIADKEQWKADYESKNIRPKEYKTADKLNEDRMRAFADSIGNRGLLSSVAQTVQKASGREVTNTEFKKDRDGKDLVDKTTGEKIKNEKYYKNSSEYKKWFEDKKKVEEAERTKQGVSTFTTDEQTKWQKTFDETYATVHNEGKKEPSADSINKKRLRNTKMVIGGAAALAGGMALGAGVGGLLGATGAGAFASRPSMVENAAGSKFVAGMNKELKKLEDIEKRLVEMKSVLKDRKTEATKVFESKDLNLKDIMTVELDSNKNEVRDADGNIVIKNIDKDNLNKAISDEEILGKTYDIQLKTMTEEIIKNGGDMNDVNNDSRIRELKEEMSRHNIKTNRLNSLKDIEEKIRTAENRIFDLTGEKSKAKDTGGKPAGATPPPSGK